MHSLSQPEFILLAGVHPAEHSGQSPKSKPQSATLQFESHTPSEALLPHKLVQVVEQSFLSNSQAAVMHIESQLPLASIDIVQSVLQDSEIISPVRINKIIYMPN